MSHALVFWRCAPDVGITVTAYADRPEGTMSENAEGSGVFTDVTLRPQVTIAELERIGEATELHHEAHRMCFIANSVNFPSERCANREQHRRRNERRRDGDELTQFPR